MGDQVNVTIFLPVSRQQYLHQVFSALELLECDKDKTNLLVVVDGDAPLFVEARNFCENSKFGQRLAVQFDSKHNKRHYDILGRRMRIADIHNFAKDQIGECDYVFGVEDDTVIQPSSLKKLIRDYVEHPFAGYISGVQLGRWGIPYVGAWMVDDVYEPKRITSDVPKQGLTEVDAAGFYCYLTKRETFVGHDYKPFENNGLGPDVDFGIELRRQGLINYIDWSIQTTHLSKDKRINLFNTEPMVIEFTKNQQGRWRQRTIK